MTGDFFSYVSRIPSIVPQSASGAVAGDYLHLKNMERCSVLVDLGAITTSVTVRLRQAKDVSGTAVKNLLFSAVHRTGGKLGYTGRSTKFTLGETVTGTTSSATGVIHKDYGSELILHTIDGTFQANEPLTGSSSACTATSTTAITDFGMKCRVEMTAAATVALTNGSECYEIDIDPASLDVNNDFDCIIADVSAMGGTSLVSISYLCAPLKYKGDPQLSCIVN